MRPRPPSETTPGQTSSGKTFTMGLGKEQLEELRSGGGSGDLVIPYAVQQLFQAIGASRDRTYTVCVSFVEVYMVRVRARVCVCARA